MADILGYTVMFDSLCDDNQTEINSEENQIDTNVISGNDNRRQNNFKNNIYYGDYEYQDLDEDHLTVSEKYNRVQELPIHDCVSYSVRDNFTVSLALASVTQTLGKLDLQNVKTIVAVVTKNNTFNDIASMWGVSVNEGQIYVNKLSSVMLETP